MNSYNEKNFRLNLLRQGCLYLGIAFLVGVISRNYFVPAPIAMFYFGIFTGIIYLCISFILQKKPKLLTICSWIFSVTFLINSSIIALSNIGFAAPVVGLIAISPAIAALLLGSRGGIAIYIGALICLFAVFWIDFNHIIPITELPRLELYKAKIIVMPIILTISLLVALAYEKSRKNNEYKLQDAFHQKEISELHLNQTNKIANIGGWSIDAESQKLWWSEQTYRIHELPIGAKIEVADALYFYAEEARPIITAAVKKGIELGEGWDLELPFVTAKERKIWVRAVGICQTNPDGSKTLRGTFQDITEKRINEERLKAARDEAIKASAAKTLFLANMSHEIRTPMNGVLGNAGLLVEDNLSPAQKRIVATILKSGESMMQILNDILDFSKIDAEQLSLYPQTFDLCEQFTSIYHLFEMRASEKGIDFHLDIEQEIPSNVYSDSTRIRQIISNLVSNAIKFTDKGSVTLRVRNKDSNKNKIKIRAEIEDTGIGIDDNILQNLFKEFTQADLSTTKEFGGTGLGLAISQRLAKLLGSKIEVESAPGKGSIFSIELDLKLVPLVSSETASKEKSGDEEKLEALSILLVEDNDINLELTGSYLNRFGITFDTAINGKEAVGMIKMKVYDIVLMDCQMPIMDGYDATKAIRNLKLSQQPTIIAITANAMNGDEEKCLNAGMDDYLSKPISRAKLTKILEKWYKIISHKTQLKA